MRFRELNVGCVGGGTGMPSLLGGLKRNPWLRVNAIVTMFDSGGSSGQLRDELGVLPPGDVLKCALALSPNEGEARIKKILDACREVAAASGTEIARLLGLGDGVSSSEAEMLDRIHARLRRAATKPEVED